MKFDGPDIVVFILTGAIGIVLISVVLSSVITGKPMSDNGSAILGDMVIAMIAIISNYIGRKMK